MKRLVLPAILALAAVAPAQQSGTGQLDASPSLFTVMAAINAAGYDAGLDSPGADPLRKAVRDELAKRQISSLAALKEFYAAHRKRTGSEDLSQYISFALSVSSPPAFQFKEKDADIPPDAAALKGLTPLLVAFYREANIDDLWRRSQPHILSVIARYHRPVLEDVEQVNAYLRQQTSGVRGRRFQIFIELLAEPNQVQTRSYGYDYYVVVTPSPEPRAFDIRHAYLHYTLEPLTTRYREIVDRKKVLFENLDRATALDSSFKQDPLLMTTECLIKAVEARLDHKSGAVDEDLHQGFILTPYFYEQLGLYEKQETSMAEYYITLLGAIDLAKEERRLSQVEFSNRKTVAGTPPPAPVPQGPAKTLEEAENLYAARQLDKAKEMFLAVVEQAGQKPLRASAYYGLARIAALERDPAAAESLFLKALDNDPEPQVKAWCLVYLGRLAGLAQEFDKATRYFRDALEIQGGSQKALDAARAGLQQVSGK
ncbi:MAG: tetratricopeptide repeat protein [Bryobacteraceae bacterium]